MNFRATLTDEAKADAQVIYDWLYKRSPDGAEKWFDALSKALEDIEFRSVTFALAAEPILAAESVREHNFSTKYGLTYRLLFRVVEAEIQVLYIRGPGQAPLK